MCSPLKSRQLNFLRLLKHRWVYADESGRWFCITSDFVLLGSFTTRSKAFHALAEYEKQIAHVKRLQDEVERVLRLGHFPVEDFLPEDWLEHLPDDTIKATPD